MKKDMENCNFCKIINKKKKANIVYENDLVCCFLSEEPINEGHMLIAPKKHCLDLDQIDDEIAIEIMRISKIMVKVLKDTYKLDGYSIMQNGGTFNNTGHYHMHLFPRYKGDSFSWSYGEENSNTLEIVSNKIQQQLKEYAIK
ncbi:HIT family protein [Clostridium sp. L74]|uniref:HIT family protein n=1 Tax=Clostridium sp. L74 TaxID=1560217 RepID=UPI0006ABB34E|nr:HIT family protein [Clostridium sp. L74]EJP6471667.1 HIT family protein [Clostridium botulinum]KOR23822.1 HIT family hydrolase [Clostridium sp. L74]